MTSTFTIGAALPLEVEAAADAYNAHGRLAKDSARWGQDEEDHLSALAAALTAAYAKHGIADDDRLSGFES